MICPKCGSEKTKSNGSVRGNKKAQCKECNYQFVLEKSERFIEERQVDVLEIVDRLLLERLSLAAIARVTNVSERWLQDYVNNKLRKEVKREVEVTKKPKGKIVIQADELWSYVGNKECKVWVWLAIDNQTREIVGCYVGDRSENGARGLWKSLPPEYRQCATIYTDFWEAYKCVLPSKRHHAVGKETGKTSYIERFNCTLRHRVGRLVRKTLSFSKSLENHIGAVWHFIHYYNQNLQISCLTDNQ
jgi:IS1 family transposase/transposase-like protein